VVRLRLTAMGQAFFKNAVARMDQKLIFLLGALPASDRNALFRILSRLGHYLAAMTAPLRRHPSLEAFLQQGASDEVSMAVDRRDGAARRRPSPTGSATTGRRTAPRVEKTSETSLIQVAPASRGELTEKLALTGNIRARNEVDVVPQAGRANRVPWAPTWVTR